MSGVRPAPTLSVCIPAYNRPEYFREALRSVLAAPATVSSRVELVVSDDSTTDAAGEIWRAELTGSRNHAGWQGWWAYHHNRLPLGMAANWNRCIDLAKGRYVLILHDDDFLLPGGLEAIVVALDHAEGPVGVVVFGVDVVDAGGKHRRRQAVGRRRYLPAPVAVARLLSNSSFVRFPAMVVAHSAYKSVSPFDEEVGEVADVLMWARLAAAYGFQLEAAVVAAYRVHPGALTTGMWREQTLRAAEQVFDDVAVRRRLRPAECRRLQGRWMSQFVLAGAWRRLQDRDADGALEALSLFDTPSMAGLAVPPLRRVGRRVLATVARTRLGGRPPSPVLGQRRNSWTGN